MENIDLEKEKIEILNAYKGLLRTCKRTRDKEDTKFIRKAFNVALDAHSDMRRKSGEPYIYHPIAVARICSEEIGLGPTAIACALLHDTVEDTDITLDDIENMFNPKCRQIIDGLTKISGVFDHSSSMQAENFRKMLLTLSEDVRVILIKIADRLHNMRTLGSMKREKQLKIASETQFLFAPLAHRLGLYTIKGELEDLSFKYKNPEIYAELESKLQKTKEVRNRFIRGFCNPIKKQLDAQGFKYKIKARTKSIASIAKKINTKEIPFEEIYDLFAIRIIVESTPETEKADCWQAYSLVTDFYQPNPDRLRDWVSIPKANGYESLHTTVMSPTGKWVEVQIRTVRMDDIAEKGYAAHWKYKESGNTNSGVLLDRWLGEIRDLLENQDSNALDFIDEFKLNLFSDEIYLFTPKGDLKTLPKNATALDFAFDIHTHVGAKCIGAKVNNKLVPLSHTLKSGDQIEILTSKKQTPKEDWLGFVTTARAKQKIKYALKEEKRQIAEVGKEVAIRKFNHLNISFNEKNIHVLINFFKVKDSVDLFFKIAQETIDISDVKALDIKGGYLSLPKTHIKEEKEEFIPKESNIPSKNDVLLIGEDAKNIDYSLAKCCQPIPGDDVFGFVTINDGIKIHRHNCPNATQLLSKYAYRVIKAVWEGQEKTEFETSIKFQGIDDIGIVKQVTDIISVDMHINMKAISFESIDGTFNGLIKALVFDTKHLDTLIQKLHQIKGMIKVERIDVHEVENH